MSSTKHKLLKICKLKFSNYYEMHSGVSNIPVFVEKFIHGICIGRIPVKSLQHLSGQLMLLSIFASGCGACRGIACNETLGEIVPYYILAFGLLYMYFSISALIDVKGKRMVLKTNLIDFLENNMSVRIRQSKLEQERLDKMDEELLFYKETGRTEKKVSGGKRERGNLEFIEESQKEELTAAEQKELSQLLTEFELIY